MNIADYLNSLNKDKAQGFMNATSSKIEIKKQTNKQVSDTSWIDMLEECIPYLDNIIRNPRRFIVQEENIVPIAKAKVVTEESIKHLAQHTQLIQDVKEDGTIMPEKLLNVYREETVDLYENRFIKSLVDNLYVFVSNKLKESDQRTYAKTSNDVTYEGLMKKNKEEVSVKVILSASSYTEENNDKDGHTLVERIEHIKEVMAAFRSSTFIKSLKDSNPVRSPIRKTNVILKEPNFIKALELWEYLEKNNIKPMTQTENKTEILSDKNVKDKYDLTFFMQNDALERKIVNMQPAYNDSIITKLVQDFVFSGNVSEKDFKRILNSEFKKAIRRRAKIEKDIKKTLDNFFLGLERKRTKAMTILK